MAKDGTDYLFSRSLTYLSIQNFNVRLSQAQTSSTNPMLRAVSLSISSLWNCIGEIAAQKK
jgi:hypothetical protein